MTTTGVLKCEDPFRALFECVDVGMAIAERDGRLTQVNPGFCSLTGYTAEELVGRSISEITHPDDQDRDRAAFRAFVGAEFPSYDIEKRYLKKDGTSVWVHVTANALRDPSGTCVGTAAVVQNIEQRRRAEEVLRQAERRQRMLAHIADIGGRFSSAAEVMSAVCAYIASEFGLTRCGLSEVDTVAGKVIVRYDYCGDRRALSGEYPIGSNLSWLAHVTAGQAIAIADAATDPRTAADYASNFAPLEVRSLLIVPIRDSGQWRSHLWITDHEPRRWTESEIDTMKSLADRMWIVVDRKRAEEDLRASEVRFRTLVENMSEGVMLVRADGSPLYRNPAWLRIHAVAQPSDDFDPGDIPARWKSWNLDGTPLPVDAAPLARVLRGETFRDQMVHVESIETGGDLYGSYNGRPVFDATGRIAMGVITIRDISAEVRARQALESHRRRLTAFFESNLFGAIFWNTAGEITDANDRFLQMVGYSRDDLRTGRVSWQHMTPAEYWASDEFALNELRATGIDTPYEKEFIRKDGSRLPVLIGASMLDEKRHEGIAFVLDISRRKEAEAGLRRAQLQLKEHAAHLEQAVAERTAQLEDVVKELSTFSYSVSHDLRAPLRTIVGFSDILTTDHAHELPAEARDHLFRIARAATKMDLLVTDVLAYSRISRADLRMENLDADALVRDVIESYAAGATFEIVGPLPRVHGSRTALQQSLSNLISNAVKFRKPDVECRIVVRAERLGDTVRILVEDNGIGIEPRHFEKIWGMFERLNPKYEGTGIGLALVRRAVERMGGTVGVTSHPGVGSTFWLQLRAGEPQGGER